MKDHIVCPSNSLLPAKQVSVSEPRQALLSWVERNRQDSIQAHGTARTHNQDQTHDCYSEHRSAPVFVHFKT